MTDFSDLVWQQIHWPMPLSAETALHLLRRLATDEYRAPVVFETRADEGRVMHVVGTAPAQIRDVTSVLQALVPGVLLSGFKASRKTPTEAARLKLSQQTIQLAVDRASSSSRAILGALSAAKFRKEAATLQVIIGRSLPPRLSSARPMDPAQSWISVLAFGGRPAPRDVARSLAAKAGEPGYQVHVRVATAAASEGRRQAIMRGVLAALRTAQPPGNRMEFLGGAQLDSLSGRSSLRLSAPELLALVGWPLDSEDLPGMPALHPRPLPLLERDIEKERVFATTTAPGPSRPLGISVQDALFHTSVVGPTGVGKSTALLNLITADMAAGQSVLVLDPKADLVQDVLARVPEGRRGDVVVIDPAVENPVGLNPLDVPGVRPELLADGVLQIFRELFPSAFGPRTSDVLHAALLTLASRPGATLTMLPRLLTDQVFRRSLTMQIDDPEGLESFWVLFDSLSGPQQSQYIGPVLSRLRQFLLRPSLRAVLDQAEPRFRLKDLFDRPLIVLVPINTGLLGKEAGALLGSLLVSQLWNLILGRAATEQRRRTPVSIYVDEAQEFIRLGGDLSDALARSRSLGASWTLANQYRAQFSPEMRAAVDANARNKIVFSLESEDAKAFARMAPTLDADDFMALDVYEVYASLLRGGRNLGWVSGRTLPPPPEVSDPAELAAESQLRYGRQPTDQTARPATQIDATISAAIGRKRRQR